MYTPIYIYKHTYVCASSFVNYTIYTRTFSRFTYIARYTCNYMYAPIFIFHRVHTTMYVRTFSRLHTLFVPPIITRVYYIIHIPSLSHHYICIHMLMLTNIVRHTCHNIGLPLHIFHHVCTTIYVCTLPVTNIIYYTCNYTYVNYTIYVHTFFCLHNLFITRVLKRVNYYTYSITFILLYMYAQLHVYTHRPLHA